MAISGVISVWLKNELIRNITTELGYANAKMRQAPPSPFIVLLPSTVAGSFHFCTARVQHQCVPQSTDGVTGGSDGGLAPRDIDRNSAWHLSREGNCCQPIYSGIASWGGETNWLQFAVPGGLIGGGTKIDPTLYRTDRLARQTFSAVGKLPQNFTEDKKQANVSKLVRGELLLTSARRRPAATYRGPGGPGEDPSDVAHVDGDRGEGYSSPLSFVRAGPCNFTPTGKYYIMPE
ncbi:hypothetical protein EDB85DRAFT_1889794 [Lactarius pseudohatsudake]|nr:hypothetical protein EDB85DRAFT_1889794 [Lactarius pseudohatsudake]